MICPVCKLREVVCAFNVKNSKTCSDHRCKYIWYKDKDPVAAHKEYVENFGIYDDAYQAFVFRKV